MRTYKLELSFTSQIRAPAPSSLTNTSYSVLANQIHC